MEDSTICRASASFIALVKLVSPSLNTTASIWWVSEPEGAKPCDSRVAKFRVKPAILTLYCCTSLDVSSLASTSLEAFSRLGPWVRPPNTPELTELGDRAIFDKSLTAIFAEDNARLT